MGLDNHDLVGLNDDSFGLNGTLGLENDFTSELLGGGLLSSTSVDGLLSNDSLGLPDGFNLEEALKFVGLDEAESEVGRILTDTIFQHKCLIIIIIQIITNFVHN